MINKLSPNTAASLATEGHIYCAGTLAQCLHRWKKLALPQQSCAFLKVGRDGFSPTLIRGEELQNLAADPGLLDAWLR
jgi:hypothetical protein